MRNLVVFVLSFFWIVPPAYLIADEPLKIAVISDTHYLSLSLAQKGKALDIYEKSRGRNIDDLHAVLDTVLTRIKNESPDILLIAGDITNHGEKQSHLDFVNKLNSLRQIGMKIFVVPGNHDVNIPDSESFVGDFPAHVESVSAAEFADIYKDFGYNAALSRDSASLSYLVSLDDKRWLLCFDSNRHSEYKTSSISAGRILPQTLEWAKNILLEAEKKNITVFAMMHHGLLEHMPYQAQFFSSYIISDWEAVADMLTDWGLKAIFTGHFHANDITLRKTAKGNTIYDIETGSLSAYPFPYRIISLSDCKMDISSYFIESIAENANLREKYFEILKQKSKETATNLLKRNGMNESEQMHALADLLARIAVLHAAGDEVMDAETKHLVKRFSELTDNDDLDDTFQLDYLPADNNLTIYLCK